MRPRLAVLAAALLVLAGVAVLPASAHHKPGHSGGPTTTSTLPATTTTGAMPTTTTLDPWDPATGIYGPRDGYLQPAGSVSVSVGSLNQALLDGQANGTKFWLQPGIHRPAAEIATMLVPKQGQEIHGAPGAILSGSVVLSSWTSDGSGHWFATGQTQRGVDGPELYQGNPISPADAPRSWKSESVWIDNVIQKHQNALVDVGAGEWFFDYAANRIYIGTDPAGKTVETAMADRAIVGGGSGVTIRNLVVEKFMTPIQVTAIDNNGATGWQLLDCDVRWNHGAGSKISDGGRTAGTRIREQGQLGVAGGGTALIFERNEVATNNTIGIDRGFEAGGTKFVFSTDAQIQENWVHHNNGNGLWLDISNTNPVVQRNLAEDNNWIGIFQEIGFGGRIIWNTSRRNGLDYGSFAPQGGGIVVSTTAGVEVAHNTLVDNRGGGVWALRDSRAGGVEGYELRDLWVHDNDITMHSGLGGGSDQPGNGIQDFTTGVAYTQNNQFNGNRYVVTSVSTTFWYWSGGPKTWAQWQALPQDAAGTATVG